MSVYKKCDDNSYKPYSMDEYGMIYLFDIWEDDFRYCFFVSIERVKGSVECLGSSHYNMWKDSSDKDFYDFIISTGLTEEFEHFNACGLDLTIERFIPITVYSEKSLDDVVKKLEKEIWQLSEDQQTTPISPIQ